jgi:hypothetical protein
VEAEADERRGSPRQRQLLQLGYFAGIAVALAAFVGSLLVHLRPVFLSAVIAFVLWAAVYFVVAVVVHMPRAWWRAKWRDPLEVLGIVAPGEDPLENLRRPPRP